MQISNGLAGGDGGQGLMAEHRRQLETAIRDIKTALSGAQRSRAYQQLKMLLSADAGMDAIVTDELAALEKLQPMTREYYQKLDHIRSAVTEAPGVDPGRLAARARTESGHYAVGYGSA